MAIIALRYGNRPGGRMDHDVGQEIRRLREQRGWSQAKLAVAAEMAVSGVSQIENGKRNLSTATLVKLARALDVEVADFFPKAEAPLSFEDLVDEEDRQEEAERERQAGKFKASFSLVEDRIRFIENAARVQANYTEDWLLEARELEKTGKLTYGRYYVWDAFREKLTEWLNETGLSGYSGKVELGEESVSPREREAVDELLNGMFAMWNLRERIRVAERENHQAAGVAGTYEPKRTMRTFEDTSRPVGPDLKVLQGGRRIA